MRILNRKMVLSELGKFFLDIAKLIFGGIILVGIMDLEINRVMLFCVGIVVMCLVAVLGVILISLSDYNK